MDFEEQVAIDKEMFSQLFEEMDAEGCFNSRSPNTSDPYDENAEHADLVRYAQTLNTPGALSFMGV